MDKSEEEPVDEIPMPFLASRTEYFELPLVRCHEECDRHANMIPRVVSSDLLWKIIFQPCLKEEWRGKQAVPPHPLGDACSG